MPVKRNEKGQYNKGVSGNPRGRPRREIEEDYLKAISEEISKADWRAIIRKAAAQEMERKGIILLMCKVRHGMVRRGSAGHG